MTIDRVTELFAAKAASDRPTWRVRKQVPFVGYARGGCGGGGGSEWLRTERDRLTRRCSCSRTCRCSLFSAQRICARVFHEQCNLRYHSTPFQTPPSSLFPFAFSFPISPFSSPFSRLGSYVENTCDLSSSLYTNSWLGEGGPGSNGGGYLLHWRNKKFRVFFKLKHFQKC